VCSHAHLLLVLQVRELEEASACAAAKAEELTASLETSEAALSEARALAAQQASRLSHLESEFEALQVRCCLSDVPALDPTRYLNRWVARSSMHGAGNKGGTVCSNRNLHHAYA
jgi:hypothetical protein